MSLNKRSDNLPKACETISESHKPQEGIKFRLHTKFLMSIIVLMCLLMTAIIFVVNQQMHQSILDEFLKRGLSVAHNLAAVNTNYVVTYNYVNIEQGLGRVAEENNLLYGAVLFFDGEVAAYSGYEDIRGQILKGTLHEQALGCQKTLIQYGEIKEEEFCEIAVPIFYNDAKWGTIRVGFSLDNINAAILKTRKVLLGLGAIGLFFGYLASLFLSRRITRPIKSLVSSVEALSNGQYDENPIRINTRDEIGYLGRRFVAMQHTVKDQIELLVETNLQVTGANENLQREIVERRQAEKALRRRDAILKAVSFATEQFLRDLRWKANISEILEKLSKATDINRVYIFQIHVRDDKTSLISLSHEWVASGTKAQISNMSVQNFPWLSAGLNRWEKIFQAGQMIQDPLKDLPESEQKALRQIGIYSPLAVPIFVGQNLWGFIGFDDLRMKTECYAAPIDALKAVAGNLGAAIQHKKTLDRLETANKAKSDFLATMSHELRTPLNHIIGFTELIVDKTFGELNEIQDEYLNDVLTSSHHLLSIINNILDVSKIETGNMELVLTDVNLKSLLKNSITTIKQKVITNDLQLFTDVAEIPDNISADEKKLKQIIYNLLSNAVKFTPKGGKLWLSARSNAEQSGIEISVKDSGIGLKNEDMKRIFNSFEQVDSSASREYEGTGLGLALTQNLVKLHGGKIWVESEGIGKGSTFRFVIPIQ